jgi:hypothetical protein
LWKAVEEEFDLPATAIQFGDCQCRQREVVRQEDQSLAGLGIVESPRHEETAGGVQSEEPFEAEISAFRWLGTRDSHAGGQAIQTLINQALAQQVGAAEKPITAEQVRKIARDEQANVR